MGKKKSAAAKAAAASARAAEAWGGQLPGECLFESDGPSDSQQWDINGDGSVLLHRLSAGMDLETPPGGSIARVALKIKAVESTETYLDMELCEVNVGKFEVPGVSDAILHMTKGQTAKAFITPKRGFGPAGRPPTVPPNSTLEVSLTLIDWHPVLDVSPDGDGKVCMRVVKRTRDWNRPKELSSVAVTYKLVAQTEPEEVVEEYKIEAQDPTVEGEGGVKDRAGGESNDLDGFKGARQFMLDEGEAPLGLELAIKALHLGEEGVVKIDSKFGLNTLADPKLRKGYEVFENVNLVVESLCVHGVAEMPLPQGLLLPEKFDYAERTKEMGNSWVRRGDFERALRRYDIALEFVAHLGGEYEAADKDRAKDLRALLQLNRAHALLKLHRYPEAIEAADMVLGRQPQNAKALYRKAKALQAQDDHTGAVKTITEASYIDPDITETMKRIINASKKNDEEIGSGYSGWFNGPHGHQEPEGTTASATPVDTEKVAEAEEKEMAADA
eukprot:GHVU01196865.1.p1 GENE.GHVU01196865.1~~GHVU01196865.1.p1  ORF type:complete len:501 (+),score=114.98 GHVU01196865.1:195-1697(+)